MQTMRHLIGATNEGRDKTCDCMSCVSDIEGDQQAHASGLVLFSGPKGVFEEGIKNTANTE